jgi:Arylsulfotransferase (ASST).
MKKAILSILFLLLFPVELSFAQAYPGYVLFAPNNSRYTYLIDGNNQIIHQWTHTRTGGYSCYLLEDGTLMRTANATSSQLNGGGATGIVQKVAWDGTLLWEFTYATATYRSHHDIAPLPNGNVLLIAWETKTAAQAVAMGLNHSASLWPDHVIEVQPVGSNGGNIVWRWNFWDHLIQAFDPNKPNYGTIADHPELLDINTGSSFGDWMHCNGIDYNAALDQIVISSHNLNEIYVIDHSTTTQEAAGHTGGRWGKGGDFLYRWGSPTNYKMNTSNYFKVVHGVNWIKDDHPGGGNILAYNNGFGTNRSEIVELKPDKDSLGNYIWIPGTPFSPATPNWSYSAPGFYSLHLGSCQRMPNGNTFIAESVGGYLFEVDSVGNTVWSYNRGGEIARAMNTPLITPG